MGLGRGGRGGGKVLVFVLLSDLLDIVWSDEIVRGLRGEKNERKMKCFSMASEGDRTG